MALNWLLQTIYKKNQKRFRIVNVSVSWSEFEHAVNAGSGSSPRLIVLIYEISPLQILLAFGKYLHCDFGDFPQVIPVCSCFLMEVRIRMRLPPLSPLFFCC
jgi:hypothetical protein